MVEASGNENTLIQERDSISRGSRLHSIHWGVLSLSLLLTLIAWHFSNEQIDNRVNAQFQREADQVVELVSERMRKYEDALWGGVSAIQAHGGDISFRDWRVFAEHLRIEVKYPGINGIGVVHQVPPDKLSSYLAEQRMGRPQYALHPKHNEAEYWPITCIEPVSTNAKAVGLDMAHETNRYTAAKKARDSGVAQLTGPIVLVQDAQQTPGFLFYAPFYRGGVYDSLDDRRANITGLVYAPFVVNRLMAGTLEKERRHVGIRITDQDTVLYDEHLATEDDYDPDPLFTSTHSDGPGIDPRFHNRIFEVFQTLQSKDEIESTGIGLAIVKKIVESRGGEITVTSSGGNGAAFTFSWPTAATAAPHHKIGANYARQ